MTSLIFTRKTKLQKTMRSCWLFLFFRDNDFKVASHIISCSILYNSRLVTNMTSPVELHFHHPVGYFTLLSFFFNNDSYFGTNIMSSPFAVIRDSWSELNKSEIVVKSIRYVFYYFVIFIVIIKIVIIITIIIIIIVIIIITLLPCQLHLAVENPHC